MFKNLKTPYVTFLDDLMSCVTEGLNSYLTLQPEQRDATEPEKETCFSRKGGSNLTLTRHGPSIQEHKKH